MHMSGIVVQDAYSQHLLNGLSLTTFCKDFVHVAQIQRPVQSTCQRFNANVSTLLPVLHWACTHSNNSFVSSHWIVPSQLRKNASSSIAPCIHWSSQPIEPLQPREVFPCALLHRKFQQHYLPGNQIQNSTVPETCCTSSQSVLFSLM